MVHFCLIDWSGWSPLRSLNSCCHRLREALLLECWGSRSRASRLRFVRFLWGIWLNGCVNRLGRLGRLSGIWLDMTTGSQNQGMLGHPGAIKMILLNGESYNITALPNMADSGKVYASWSYHGRLSASTAVARGSSTGDTHKGNLLLNQVANKFIWGQCHLLHIAWKTSWRRDHSVWVVWPSLDSLSATTLSRSGMCRALRVTWFLVHQVKILHSKAQSGPDLMPPSLFMYDTTVLLSVSTSTILCMQRSWNSFKARKTALSSR